MSTVNKLSENYEVIIYYEDDASGTVHLPANNQVATANHNWVGWIDFQEYEKGMAMLFTIAGAQAQALFRIISNTSQIGAGVDNAVKTLTTPGAINAALETGMLEWSADDVTAGDRYISSEITTAVGADPLILVYLLENRRFKRTGLTTATETASA